MADDALLLENGSTALLESGSRALLETILGGSGPPDVSPPTIFVATPQTIDLLELRTGQRADTFTFELLDQQHNTIGPLAVSSDVAPHVTLDTSRSIARTCSGLAISSSTIFADSNYVPLEAIDVRRHRIRPSLVLENGARFPLGVFKIGDDNRNQFSWGTTWTPDLFDETFLIDQPLDASIGIGPGESVLGLYRAILAPYNLPAVDLTGIADVASSTALVYAAGSSGAQALKALASVLGCYPPFFDNNGVHRLKLAPATGAGPDLSYASNTRIIAGSIKRTNSGYRAPNRYQVVSSDTTSAVVGIYDLPATSPNSFAVTGERVRVSHNVPGIPTTALANLSAQIDALTDRNSYSKASFSTTVDPRHDAFSRIDLYGVPYIEQRYDITCTSGGLMTHDLIAYWG